ncbi:hypothetical protein [Chryseobacterium populi]|uniref:hypothetical protein n=1 Tax=Chryseobacterium populi TaxID=1144316 RepID=UPI0012E05196|nr:hypothetical protein [Chryseobacterium populi]
MLLFLELNVRMRLDKSPKIPLNSSLRKALENEMQSWGFLKRTGNVKEVITS